MIKIKPYLLLLLSIYSMTHAADWQTNAEMADKVTKLERGLDIVAGKILAIRREERSLSQGIEDRRNATDEQRKKLDALYDREVTFLIPKYEDILKQVAEIIEPSAKDDIKKQCSEIDERNKWFMYFKNLKSIEELQQRENDIEKEIDRIQERIRRERRALSMVRHFEEIAELSLREKIANYLQENLLVSLTGASFGLEDSLREISIKMGKIQRIQEIVARLNEEKAAIEVTRSEIAEKTKTLFDEKKILLQDYTDFRNEVEENKRYKTESRDVAYEVSKLMRGFSSNFKGEDIKEIEKRMKDMKKLYGLIEENLSDDAKPQFRKIYVQLEQNINSTMELLQKDEDLKKEIFAKDEEIQKIIDPQATDQ